MRVVTLYEVTSGTREFFTSELRIILYSALWRIHTARVDARQRAPTPATLCNLQHIMRQKTATAIGVRVVDVHI